MLKRDEIGREREKKILDPNSAHTGPRQENSKKNSKKISKIKNLFPALFSAQTGWDRPRKGKKKKFRREFCSCQTRARKFQKKCKKIQKIKKLNSAIMSIQNGLREAEKE